jgi:hypothetical protein
MCHFLAIPTEIEVILVVIKCSIDMLLIHT